MKQQPIKFSLKSELKDIFFLAVFGGLITAVPFSWNAPLKSFLIDYAASATYWVFLAKGNSYLVDYLTSKISWVEYPVKRFTLGVVVMLVYTIFVAAVLYTFWNYLFTDKSLLQIVQSISLSNIIIAILITLIISLFLHGRGFLFEWRAAALQAEKLKTESINSKYESLKNQVNPHFLFNLLNVLSGLVYEDQDKSVDFIRKMSDVYRYVLENKDQELVTIETELNFLESYLYLQKIRFEDSLNANVNVDSKKGMVPPLAIQLLVENAIKHNVVSKAKPLTVSIEESEGNIIVKNNIQEKLSKDSTGIGLENLRARYEFLTDRPVEIRNENNQFSVKIPILNLEK